MTCSCMITWCSAKCSCFFFAEICHKGLFYLTLLFPEISEQVAREKRDRQTDTGADFRMDNFDGCKWVVPYWPCLGAGGCQYSCVGIWVNHTWKRTNSQAKFSTQDEMTFGETRTRQFRRQTQLPATQGNQPWSWRILDRSVGRLGQILFGSAVFVSWTKQVNANAVYRDSQFPNSLQLLCTKRQTTFAFSDYRSATKTV